MPSTVDHPDLETLAAFVDGSLSAPERTEVVVHLDGCSQCYDFVVGIARAVEDERQEEDVVPGAEGRVVKIRRPRFSLSSVWRMAAVLAFAAVGGGGIFRLYLPYQAHLAYASAKPTISEISSVWLPLDYPAELIPTRGGGPEDFFALCGDPMDQRATPAERACLESLRTARAKFQRVPRWARSRADSRTLVSLDLALGKRHLAVKDLPADWSTDCVLVMLHRFATADELEVGLLSDVRCDDPEDQANVDLNRVLLLMRAGKAEEACLLWAELTPSVRESPVGRWHGPRC
jgi:hypothetical protein